MHRNIRTGFSTSPSTISTHGYVCAVSDETEAVLASEALCGRALARAERGHSKATQGALGQERNRSAAGLPAACQGLEGVVEPFIIITQCVLAVE